MFTLSKAALPVQGPQEALGSADGRVGVRPPAEAGIGLDLEMRRVCPTGEPISACEGSHQ